MEAPLCEIVDDDGPVGADWSEVECVSASVEGQDHVELLDEVGGGLVDCADDGLAGVA